MTDWKARLSRWFIVAMLSLPILAQTQGCLTTNQARADVATSVGTVLAAGASYLIGNFVNQLLNIPTSPFSSLRF
jgi:hypothetical protein